MGPLDPLRNGRLTPAALRQIGQPQVQQLQGIPIPVVSMPYALEIASRQMAARRMMGDHGDADTLAREAFTDTKALIREFQRMAAIEAGKQVEDGPPPEP
jgi:hypothetical protein